MKNLVTTMGLVLISSTSFAGGYSFDCSNKDGAIVVSDRGDTLKIFGKKYSLNVKLKGLELWVPLGNLADAELVPSGNRTVLYKETDNSCRDTGKLVFAQKLTILNMKTKKEIASDYFICENSYATTTGGAECSAGAHE